MCNAKRVLVLQIAAPSHPSLAEQFDITWLAVGTVVVVLESALVQHLQTKRTGEMLRVKFFAHRADTALLYRLLARLAHLVLGDVIVVLTVWLAVVLKVVSSRKCHMTLLQW